MQDSSGPLAKAVADLRQGLLAYRSWGLLGWYEIKQRYRRSFLGPFWLSISTAVMVGGMGPLYGRLFGQPISEFLPYIAVSMVVWQFISTTIIDSCQVFINAESYIRQIKLPLTLHVYRLIWKNLIIFFHNVAVVLPLVLIISPAINANLLLAPIGLLCLSANAVWLSLLLGILCARFRDIPLMVASVVQIAFFLTPVFWKAEMLGTHAWVADFNPFFHFLELVRAPMLGGQVSALTWIVVLGTTVIGYVLALMFFSRFRTRIAYWL